MSKNSCSPLQARRLERGRSLTAPDAGQIAAAAVPADISENVPPQLYGDNVFEKHGINRDRTGDGEKPRCLCGKRGIFNRDGAANYQTT